MLSHKSVGPDFAGDPAYTWHATVYTPHVKLSSFMAKQHMRYKYMKGEAKRLTYKSRYDSEQIAYVCVRLVASRA